MTAKFFKAYVRPFQWLLIFQSSLAMAQSPQGPQPAYPTPVKARPPATATVQPTPKTGAAAVTPQPLLAPAAPAAANLAAGARTIENLQQLSEALVYEIGRVQADFISEDGQTWFYSDDYKQFSNVMKDRDQMPEYNQINPLQHLSLDFVKITSAAVAIAQKNRVSDWADVKRNTPGVVDYLEKLRQSYPPFRDTLNKAVKDYKTQITAEWANVPLGFAWNKVNQLENHLGWLGACLHDIFEYGNEKDGRPEFIYPTAFWMEKYTTLYNVPVPGAQPAR